MSEILFRNSRNFAGLRLSLIAAAFAPALMLAFPAAHSAAAEHPLAERPLPVIQVSGEGRIAAAPDMAVLQLGVIREADNAREALDANSAAMNRIVETMKAEEIEARDLQTSGFSVHPRYFYPKQKSDGSQEQPRIVGYTVTNNLSVRVRDLTKVGAILDLVVTLGMNSGGDISFQNAEPEIIVAKARALAMQDAKTRAETLAEAAGVKLGPVLEISESFNAPRPVSLTRGKLLSDAASGAVPVEGGESTYTVSVQARWEIVQ